MEFIRDIMPFTPKTWDKAFVYHNKRYILVDVDEATTEYEEVVNHFRTEQDSFMKPSGIQRVQHPFAFVRYQLHKESLTRSGYPVREKIIYKCINEQDISMYLEYNCDQRRVSGGAFNLSYLLLALPGINRNYTQEFTSSNSTQQYVRQQYIRDYYLGDRDSNTYPEYVITVAI